MLILSSWFWQALNFFSRGVCIQSYFHLKRVFGGDFIRVLVQIKFELTLCKYSS